MNPLHSRHKLLKFTGDIRTVQKFFSGPLVDDLVKSWTYGFTYGSHWLYVHWLSQFQIVPWTMLLEGNAYNSVLSFLRAVSCRTPRFLSEHCCSLIYINSIWGILSQVVPLTAPNSLQAPISVLQNCFFCHLNCLHTDTSQEWHNYFITAKDIFWHSHCKTENRNICGLNSWVPSWIHTWPADK